MKYAIQKNLWLLLAILVVMPLGMLSCSPKKNTAATRRYQAFITRYNIYYNGDTHYKETLQEMEDKYEDDYSQLVLMHPVEAKANTDAPQPSGDFTRSIEKGQKAIQLRSIKKRPANKGKTTPQKKEWLKREEYNPFLHNAWMMMGRGQYFNGDFLGAASTFFYISKHFWWLPATVTDALLWQARSYISLGWLFEAEMIIERIKPDQLTSKQLAGLYNFVKADYLIHSERLEEAIPFLQEAIKASSGSQKTRLYFLLGQIYQRTGNKAAAYQAYDKAGSSPSTPYRTKFNARIKQSEVYEGKDIEPEVKALKRMVKYDRNKEYLDQVYYAIGNLYLSRGDTTNAIENYELAAEKSTRNGIDKAINNITLGGLYYDRHQYDKAQPAYSEAVPLLPKDYPNYAMLKRRSDVLDELAVYSENVTLQDSLLRLAAMTPEQRLEVINKIIEDLKKKEKEEAEAARREEFLAEQAANGNQLQDNNANSFVINSDNSWYFYNTATRNSGKTEFQRKWGSRKLEDNWRRRNKSSFNASEWAASALTDSEEAEDTEVTVNDSVPEVDEKELEKSADPHYPEYYLAQIPETEDQKATAHEIIQEGLYNMGVILKDKMEDNAASFAEFNRLLNDYPDNVYRLDVYYNLYLMYARANQPALAKKYRQLILNEFGDSPYGVALRDPNYIENLRLMDKRQQELYDATYQAYLDNRNADVHKAYEEMSEKFPLSKIMPKFMFLHALAYVTEKKPEEFNAVLKELLDRYPDTDITPVASAWLKGMAQGKQLQSGSGNMRGMIWDMRLGNDSTAVAEGEAAFELRPDDKQLLVMTFATDEVPSNELLYEIARHNFKSFVVKDFDLEQLNFGRLGMIVIRDFDSLDELNHYRKVMNDSPDFKLPPNVRPVVISDANFKILLDEGRSFDEYFRFLQEQNAEQAEEWAGPAPTPPQEFIEAQEEINNLEKNNPEENNLPETSPSSDPENTLDEEFDFEPIEFNSPKSETETMPQKHEDEMPVVSDPQIVPSEDIILPAAEETPEQNSEPEAIAPATSKKEKADSVAPTYEPPVIVPIPRQPYTMPSYAPGSEGDDSLFD